MSEMTLHVLQTHDAKFELSEAEHATSRSQMLPTLRVSGEETFCFFGTRTLEWETNPPSLTAQAGNLTTAAGPSHR